MTFRVRAVLTAAFVAATIAPIQAAHAAPASTRDSVTASDTGTTVIRFREEWDPATVAATGGVAGPFVGQFDAAVDEFVGLDVTDGRSYTVTAFDGEQSGVVELTVPVGTSLAPGTYTTEATDAGTDVPGFFFHGHLGYAGFGTGSFTVVRSTYDADTGGIASFLATYDEVLDDSLGDSHVVGVVSWADIGVVPQVVQVSSTLAPVVTGLPVTVRGMVQTTGAPGGTLEVRRTSHGRTASLPDVTTDVDGTFAVTDRPPCAGSVTYVISAPSTPDVLGESVSMTIPLVRCTTSAPPGRLLGAISRSRSRG